MIRTIEHEPSQAEWSPASNNPDRGKAPKTLLPSGLSDAGSAAALPLGRPWRQRLTRLALDNELVQDRRIDALRLAERIDALLRCGRQLEKRRLLRSVAVAVAQAETAGAGPQIACIKSSTEGNRSFLFLLRRSSRLFGHSLGSSGAMAEISGGLPRESYCAATGISSSSKGSWPESMR